MAWQVSKRVWDSLKDNPKMIGEKKNPDYIDSGERLILLALADKADENGVCWPKHDTSYQTLGDMVGVNRRSAMRLIDNLAQVGHIWKSETVGRGNSNIFIVAIGLTQEEVKERLTLIGVTDDTISDGQKVLSETPIIEPEKEMVLPVTRNGVADDTNNELNGVTGNTQSYLINPSIPSLLSKDNSGNGPPSPGNKSGLKNKSSPPQAVQVYRSVANRFPDKATWEMINTRVGTDQEDLDFWKLVVIDYIACGFNKINIKAMLECFDKRELPKTRQGKNGVYRNGSKPTRTRQPGIIAAAQGITGDEEEPTASPGPGGNQGAKPRRAGILSGD